MELSLEKVPAYVIKIVDVKTQEAEWKRVFFRKIGNI